MRSYTTVSSRSPPTSDSTTLAARISLPPPHTNILCAFDDHRWQVIDRAALETMNEADFDRLLLVRDSSCPA